MNALEAYIAAKSLNPDTVMSHLQDVGLVSDNAINPNDVYAVDALNAVARLKEEERQTYEH